MSLNKTPIEWVENPDGTQGYTWNPITGCLNGCEYCYARKLANGRLRKRYLANNNTAPTIGEGVTPYNTSRLLDLIDPFYPRFWPKRLDQPIYYEKPCGIFTVDMGELFGDWIPQEWQANVFEVIERCPQHRFYLLTKQPQNLIKFSPFPDNCFVGVTATGYKAFNEALDYLKDIEANIKFISIEPLLEAISFYPERLAYCGINQLIIGAQTKPYKPPKLEWVEEVVRAADKAGILVFLKNNLVSVLENREPFISTYKMNQGKFIQYPRQELPVER